jgi:hypothetical protein
MSDNEDEKDLIAYCGLYCGDCFAHKGTVADLARDLRKELRQSKFDKTAESLSNVSFFKVFENYGQCYEVLGALVRLRCKNACRGGGGPPFCKMRKCCQKKGIDEFLGGKKYWYSNIKPKENVHHLKSIIRKQSQNIK